MSNDIIIKNFEDEKWIKSEVLDGLMSIAKKEIMESEASQNDEDMIPEEAMENLALDMEEIDYEDDDNEEVLEQYEEDKKRFATLKKVLMEKSDRLAKEGRLDEAFEVERKMWQIHYSLRNMKKLCK